MNGYWTPAPIWAGGAAFVIGGGPSLAGFDFGRLRGRQAVAVNAAAYDVTGPGVALMFHDLTFFERHRGLVLNWEGSSFTTSAAVKAAAPSVNLLDSSLPRASFADRGRVKLGRSSGHSAVGLAVALGARRVVLLGFDARPGGDGATHYHGRYGDQRTKTRHLDRYRSYFAGWRGDAAAVGVEIVNAGPASAIEEFPMVDIDDELAAA